MDWGMGSRPRLHEGRLFAGTTEVAWGERGKGAQLKTGDHKGRPYGGRDDGGGMGSRPRLHGGQALRGNNGGGGAGMTGGSGMRMKEGGAVREPRDG